MHIQKEHPAIEVINDYDPETFEDPFSSTPTGHKQPSDIWMHFSKVKDQKAKCDVCMAVLSVSGDHDYSNLFKHLRVMHSDYLSRVKEFLSSNAHEVDAEVIDTEVAVNETCLNDTSDCDDDEFNCNSHENTVNGSDEDIDEKTMNETGIWHDIEETSDILAQAITNSKIPCSASPKEFDATDAKKINNTETNERPKRSLIWTYFKRSNPNQVECLKCRGLVKYSSILCTTSNMWKHMELKHQLNASVLKLPRKPSDKVTGKKLVFDDIIEAKEKKRSSTRTPSTVWQHFIRHSPERAECKMCNAQFKLICGSTSNLRYHVQAKHAEALPE